MSSNSKYRAIQFKIEGVEELVSNLGTLVPEIQNKSGRSAMRYVSLAMAENVRRNAPVGDTGNLKNSIKNSVRVFPGAIVAFAKAGTTKGLKGNHAHLVEYGHALVKGKYLGRRTLSQRVPEHPFMRPALWNNRAQYEKIAAEGVAAALTKLKRKGAF